jgi:predicted CoA-binding protein
VDIVNVFRRSEYVPAVVDDVLQKGARCIWMQEGVINEAAAEKAVAAGVSVVMDRCILKEMGRLIR